MRFHHLFALALLATPLTAQLHVNRILPNRHTLDAALDVQVIVEFDRPVDPSTVTEMRPFGSFTGPLKGVYSLDPGNRVLRFTPQELLHPGEVVTINFSHKLAAQDGTNLRDEGYAHRFRAITAPATMNFVTEDVLSVRSEPNTLVRLYGANALDLDSDGRIDLATINEVSSDVRVLLNIHGPDRTFSPFLMPTNSTGSTPSPNAAADFNDDGNIDLVTGNTGTSTLTVLLGNGDGTFSSGVDYWVGNGPRGVAILDVDGDGDMDLAAAATAAGHIAVLLNDGSANFSPGTTFDGGGIREFGMSAQDMNNDGIMDLIVGLWTPEAVAVHLGVGDGSFVLSDVEPAGGEVWKIDCGDVNGDGNMDVTTANAVSGSSAILLGDGNGNLVLHQTYTSGSYTTATDLGDLDGDGDLDWVLSDYGTGKWRLLQNDGQGNFRLIQSFTAELKPSCSVLFDIDGDGDLDMALLDELADLIRLEFNSSPASYLCFGDGTTLSPCACNNSTSVGAHRGCENSTGRGALGLATGTASISNNDLELQLSDMPPFQVGLLVSSLTLVDNPLGDGVFCIGNPLKRFPLNLANQSGSFSVTDFAGSLPLAPGDQYWFQFAFRDTAGPCGNGYNFSNMMGVAFTP